MGSNRKSTGFNLISKPLGASVSSQVDEGNNHCLRGCSTVGGLYIVGIA